MKQFSLTLIIALSFISLNAQTIEKTWVFNTIEKDNKSILYGITSNDTLTLNKGTFNYSLAPKNNLIANGDYIYQNDVLVFFYNHPNDTIRRYKITALTDSTLVFAENNIVYTFKAKEKLQKKVVSSIKTETSSFESKGFALNGILRGLLGITFLLGICYLLSAKRNAIDWKLVATGLVLQIVFALLVLKVEFVAIAFDWLSKGIVKFLALGDKGAEFLFGNLITDMNTFGYIFAFKVLPTIVFFSALTSVLYYLGILQKVVYAFAWVMSKTMRLSGAESLAAAANIFIGQTEAPLVVKPYLEKMTKSEILSLMVGGMATIAGGVLAAFIAFLGGDSIADQVAFTKHLLTASIMSAPAALLIAKMLLPQTEPEKVNKKLNVAKDKIGSNLLDAISRGTTEGVKLAVNVGAMLLVFTALIAVLNGGFSLLGEFTGLNDSITDTTNGRYKGLSLQYILGHIFAPIAWIIGVASEDMVLIGQLLGEKTIINEFIAYGSLRDMKNAGLITQNKSIIIATYALCGFANFASIGIQIGGIGVLAPSQRTNLAKFGIKALIGGTIAALLTATIAGMLIG